MTMPVPPLSQLALAQPVPNCLLWLLVATFWRDRILRRLKVGEKNVVVLVLSYVVDSPSLSRNIF